MNLAGRLPRLFVASSKEGLETAYHLQENLEFDAEVTVWTQGIFKPSRQTMADLSVAMQATDFAAFIFSPDDVHVMRGTTMPVARDNVIFELGLFAGYLGIEKCFIVQPRGEQELHLPSDLLGLTSLSYDPSRSDRNLLAALAPTSNKIKRAMRDALLNVSPPRDILNTPLESAEQKWRRLVALWDSEGLAKDRQIVGAGMPNWIGEDETGLPTEAFKRICVFLDSVAELILSEANLQTEARSVFEESIKYVWRVATHYFIPAAHISAAEYWETRELPPMGRLAALWSAPE